MIEVKIRGNKMNKIIISSLIAIFTVIVGLLTFNIGYELGSQECSKIVEKTVFKTHIIQQNVTVPITQEPSLSDCINLLDHKVMEYKNIESWRNNK